MIYFSQYEIVKWIGAIVVIVLLGRNWQQWQLDQVKLAIYLKQLQLPEPIWSKLPTVSILVAAWNEEAHIGRFLQSFHTLNYPHKQLVLCAGGNDATLIICQEASNEQIIVIEQQAGIGKQRALHQAFPHTTGEIVYLTDADCILCDDSFARAIMPIANGESLVTTGYSQPRTAQLDIPFVLWQSVTQLYGVIYAGKSADGLLGRNCAIQRDVLAKSRGLETEAITGTDYVLAKKLLAQGATIQRSTRSRIQTDYPTTIRAYMRQQSRWLRNVTLHGQRFGSWSEVRQSIQTSLIGLVMITLPFAGIFFPIFWAIWGLLFFQTLLARWRYWRVSCVLLNTQPKLQHLIYLPFFSLVDFATWASTLLNYPFEKWRTQW